MSENSKKMHRMWSENEIQSLEADTTTLEGNHFAHGSGFHKARMLREINEDDQTPKKHDFAAQNDLHERIRNDEDYDDWDYGTEAIYGSQNWS